MKTIKNTSINLLNQIAVSKHEKEKHHAKFSNLNKSTIANHKIDYEKMKSDNKKMQHRIREQMKHN
ncbi:hypothetical protein [Carnobacterium viridans]|nr:hypothetical protein [Carnobacterium viridans]